MEEIEEPGKLIVIEFQNFGVAERISDNPAFLAGRERYYEALKKAGLPER